MSMAAVKAAWQLATQPTHWEKTFHGLVPDHGVLDPNGTRLHDGTEGLFT
jgi:hypothetical protein